MRYLLGTLCALMLLQNTGCVAILAAEVLDRHSERKHAEHDKAIEYRHRERMEELRLQRLQLELENAHGN
jgi:hypothetical protein